MEGYSPDGRKSYLGKNSSWRKDRHLRFASNKTLVSWGAGLSEKDVVSLVRHLPYFGSSHKPPKLRIILHACLPCTPSSPRRYIWDPVGRSLLILKTINTQNKNQKIFNPHLCETFFFSASVTHKSKKKINFSVSWITYHRSLESTPCHGTRRAPARIWRSGNSDMAWITALCSGTPNSEWSIMRFRRHVRAGRGREPGKENGICYVRAEVTWDIHRDLPGIV